MELEKNNFIIHPIPVLEDNIIWIWVKGNQAVVVDPAVSKPVICWLKQQELNLHSVLQTHHHEDHIGGTQELLKIWKSASVIASKEDIKRIPFQTKSVLDNENLTLLGEKIKVLKVPGHTKHHFSFFISRPKDEGVTPILFCGDTLFGAGCGRLFEGSPQEMFDSINRINQLPENTKIYCAHEYTQSNLEWAHSIFPRDSAINERLKKVINLRSKGLLTLPSTISEERKTNLFLRAKNSLEFSKLRLHKDNWKT